jgi:hypothetical protein
MKRMLAALVMASSILLFANAVSAAVCVCAAVPMYPMGGNNWMHYATVCENDGNGCVNSYPTSYIGTQTCCQNCSMSPNCHNCMDASYNPLAFKLPGVGIQYIEPEPVTDLHFGEALSDLPSIDQVNHPEAFKSFLNSLDGAGTYDNLTFRFPNETNVPLVVALQRSTTNGHHRGQDRCRLHWY